MVAGDTKKIVVIKNIASNLIEEAILILRSEPGAGGEDLSGKQQAKGRAEVKNDFILKEAESIINQYIKENGLTVTGGRHHRNSRKMFSSSAHVNVLINCLLIASAAFLLFILFKLL